MRIEFIKFGNAVSVDGTNLASASNQHYEITQVSDFVFEIKSRRLPKFVTKVSVTNVSEWRESNEVEEVKPATTKAKPKATS